jgi:dihydrofolate reductase
MRSLIVAMTSQWVIGKQGDLPWRLSSDLQRFKLLTMGHCILMGRKTFTSLGRVLPGRTSIVISRQPDLAKQLPVGVLHAQTLSEAFTLAGHDSSPFVIGGGEIYRIALPHVDRVFVTWVDTAIQGDTYFPEFPTAAWKLVSEESFVANEKNQFATRYCIYERNSNCS